MTAADTVGESDKLDRFFHKLFKEMLQMSADSVQFEPVDGRLRIAIKRGVAELRSSNTRMEWFEPIIIWLRAHMGPKASKNNVAKGSDGFTCLIHVEDQSLEYGVVIDGKGSNCRQVLLTKASSEPSYCPVSRLRPNDRDNATIDVSDDFFMGNKDDIHQKLGIKRGRGLILLVEDNPDQRDLIQMVLKNEEYEVITALDGEEALEALQKEIPDLIITDLMMPKLDGAGLIQKVKADQRTYDIPVLVLTVQDDREKEFKLLSLGADDYCEKTMQRKILLKRVENLIKRSRRD